MREPQRAIWFTKSSVFACATYVVEIKSADLQCLDSLKSQSDTHLLQLTTLPVSLLTSDIDLSLVSAVHWFDIDILVTDMSMRIPWEKYEGYDIVFHAKNRTRVRTYYITLQQHSTNSSPICLMKLQASLLAACSKVLPCTQTLATPIRTYIASTTKAGNHAIMNHPGPLFARFRFLSTCFQHPDQKGGCLLKEIMAGCG